MLKLARSIINRLIVVILRAKGGVSIGSNVRVKGYPSIFLSKGAKIVINNGSMLNSSNFGYHVNMFQGVKLIADRPGAIIKIGSETRVHGSCIHAYKLVDIGCRCLIAANCQIIDCNGHELSMEAPENRIRTSSTGIPIIIEDDVWIGTGCIILPGVRIGKGSVVAAGSVVTKSMPPMSICAGNPAKVIKSFEVSAKTE